MVKDDIDRLYEQFLREGKDRGDLAEDGPGADRRQQPRLKANSTELSIRAELQVSAIDVSLSGLAFFANFPVPVGQSLNITVGQLFTVDAEVVSCKQEASESGDENPCYRIQCRFPEEEQGKYLVVAVKELDKQKK